MKLNQQLLRLNRNILVCCIISALISAFVAQMLSEEESYLNTTLTILAGYGVFFGFFGFLFYLDNKKRYQAMRPKLIKKELLKLVSSFGIGEIVYIGIRWSLMFYFLEIELEPFAASLVSEAIATLFYLTVVSAVLKATKVY
jgi:H+/Cl- antiporter ClcA